MKRFLSVTAIVMVLLFGTASMTGCVATSVVSATSASYGLNAALLGVNLTELNEDFEEMVAAVTLLQEQKAIFTDEQWKALQNISTLKDMVVKQVKEIVDLDSGSVTLSDVEYIHNLAKSAYEEGYALVEAHWSDFDPATQIMLKAFQNKAEVTEARIVELLSNPDNESINETLLLILSVLSTAVKLLSTAAAL